MSILLVVFLVLLLFATSTNFTNFEEKTINPWQAKM